MQRHTTRAVLSKAKLVPENRTNTEKLKKMHRNYMCWKINEGYLTKPFWLFCVFLILVLSSILSYSRSHSLILLALFWSFLQRDCCQLHLQYVHCVHYAQLFFSYKAMWWSTIPPQPAAAAKRSKWQIKWKEKSEERVGGGAENARQFATQ